MSNEQHRQSLDNLVDDLLEQINMGRSFLDLFDRLFERLCDIVPYNRMAVALLDESGAQLRLIASRSDGAEALKVGYTDPIAGSTLADLLRTGQPRIINDLSAYLADKPSSRSTRLIVREGMRSNLTLPLIAGGNAVGVVFFSSRTTHTYTDNHAHILKRLAGHLAVSVERAQLIDALRERNKELGEANDLQGQFLQRLQREVERQTAELKQSTSHYQLLARLGQVVNGSLDLAQLFRRTAEEMHKVVDCDRISLTLALRGNTHVAEFGGEVRWHELPPRPNADSAARWVIEQRRPRIARRLDQARPFVDDRQLFDQGYRASVHLPLESRDTCVAVLGLAARNPDKINNWNLELLQELSHVLAVAVDNALAYAQIADLKEYAERENVFLRQELRHGSVSERLIGSSPAWHQVLQAIEQVSATDSTVLILGETGTGKELIARAIHDASGRRQRLLVSVNCAALSSSLMASELFGHEPGAFSGAVRQRVGRFELAHRGTLFLDEVAEIPAETQVALLRVLQERVLERVGGNEAVSVDVRVIAATHGDLQAMVSAGRFRADLYYRLNVFPIHVPPLRQRREDIPALVEHFVALFRQRMHREVHRITSKTMDLLCAYHWPGNVRELANLIERGVIASTGDSLQIDAHWLATARPQAAEATCSGLSDVERKTIVEALAQCGGKVYGVAGAAARLGLKPTTLYGKMRKHGIQRSP